MGLSEHGSESHMGLLPSHSEIHWGESTVCRHSRNTCLYDLIIGSHALLSVRSSELSGTESAILNRELGDSESCDSNRAIAR